MKRTQEQLRHDIVNLKRSVKALEKSVDNEDWVRVSPDNRHAKWLKAQTVLVGIQNSRGILNNVQLSEDAPELLHRQEKPHDDVEQVLHKLEKLMAEVNKGLSPRPKRLRPILPTLPVPSIRKQKQIAIVSDDDATMGAHPQGTLLTTEETESQRSPLTQDLLLEPSEPTNSMPPMPSNSATLITPSLLSTSEAAAKKATLTPAFLQTSTTLQTDLSDQLAQMAQQLKLNALHFADSLAQDQSVVEETREKIGENFEVMKKERIRLRDHRGKSGGTTCLIMLILTVVIALFFLMYFIIRLT